MCVFDDVGFFPHLFVSSPFLSYNFFLVCRRSIAKRTLELVFSLFSAHNFLMDFRRTAIGKNGQHRNFIRQSIDLQYLCFRFKHLLFLRKSLFIAHLAMALAKAGKRKENEEKKMYIIVYERNVTVLKSVLFDIRVQSILYPKMLLRCLNSRQTTHNHKSTISIFGQYFDWRRKMVA